MADAARAIGRLTSGGVWVGLLRAARGWELVFGSPSGLLRPAVGERERELLLLAATAYFEERLADPPPELEATHQDLADLLAWLTASENDALRRRLLREALDAIEDGLAGETVIARLVAASGGESTAGTAEPAEAVDRLLQAYRSASR
jgi:hypothetical protein